ncbi:Retrovirus-related Pol polyprotein from transposon RE1 [Vitis vinifera]|uniref:Retrovirus-related Pol polyprotein from transposon RE1 n=1 Tax=Vitis vinifera TaxID=29760 RepID=A0A438I3D6_VITVI|nr:Retrovirus-related Pol polyprotein from transposon RE1 [Vitis vinifera]
MSNETVIDIPNNTQKLSLNNGTYSHGYISIIASLTGHEDDIPLRSVHSILLTHEQRPTAANTTSNIASPNNFNNNHTQAIVASPSNTTDKSWFLDTGATHHCSQNTSTLSGVQSYQGNDKVTVGNGQALATFIRFKTLVENKFTSCIQYLQSNNGGGFKAFAPFLAQREIDNSCLCPITLAQDGRAKRKMRHIVETSLALLAITFLPLNLLYAFPTAIFLINRMPTKAPNSLDLVATQSANSSSLELLHTPCQLPSSEVSIPAEISVPFANPTPGTDSSSTRINQHPMITPGKACQFTAAPTSTHWLAVKRLLCYLKGTPYGFQLQMSPPLDI